MPGGDRTGPMGQGAGTGAGRGRNRGAGQGRGLGGGPFAAGPGGNCICPGCGYSMQHLLGKPCNQLQCPKCGTNMIRS